MVIVTVRGCVDVTITELISITPYSYDIGLHIFQPFIVVAPLRVQVFQIFGCIRSYYFVPYYQNICCLQFWMTRRVC